MKVLKFLISGVWFGAAAYLALNVTSSLGLLPGEFGWRAVNFLPNMFDIAPFCCSFLVGGIFGKQLLTEESKSGKEIGVMGIKIPLYSAFLTIVLIAAVFGSTQLFLGDPYTEKINIVYRLVMPIYSIASISLMAILFVLLPISPFISLIGVFAALILRLSYLCVSNQRRV